MLDDPSVGLAVDGAFVWPGARSLSEGSITPDAVLLLDAGMDVILWVGQKVHPDFLTSCFGGNYDFDNLWLEERGNDEESSNAKLQTPHKRSIELSKKSCIDMIHELYGFI